MYNSIDKITAILRPIKSNKSQNITSLSNRAYLYLIPADESHNIQFEGILRQPEWQSKTARSSSKSIIKGALALQKATEREDRTKKNSDSAINSKKLSSKKFGVVSNSKLFQTFKKNYHIFSNSKEFHNIFTYLHIYPNCYLQNWKRSRIIIVNWRRPIHICWRTRAARIPIYPGLVQILDIMIRILPVQMAQYRGAKIHHQHRVAVSDMKIGMNLYKKKLDSNH